MKACYKKVSQAIEDLQKYQADHDKPISRKGFKALFKMRQTKDKETRNDY